MQVLFPGGSFKEIYRLIPWKSTRWSPTVGLLATLIGTFVLTLVYWYIYNQYRERYMAIWALSWSVYTVRFGFELLLQIKEGLILLLIGHQMTTLLSGLLILWGTYAYVGKPVNRWLVYGCIADSLWAAVGIVFHVSWVLLNLPTFVFLGLVYIWTGIMFLRSRDIEGLGKYSTGWAFILWGLHKANYPFIKEIAWLGPLGYLFAATLEFVVAAGTLLVYFEKVRKDLGASETRFRLLAENAQDMVYRYRVLPTRGMEYISPSITGFTGYTPEELYADPDLVYNIVHPDDREIINPSKVSPDSFTEPLVVRWVTKDGRTVWSEQKIVPVFNEGGELVAMEGIARDVTERKLAEEVLKRYQVLFEHARDVILIFRRDGRIIEANDAAVRSYGYTRDELLTMSIYDLRAPASKSLLKDQINQAETRDILYETLHKRKDGTIFPVEVSLQATIFDDERVLFGIVRDVTDRKKAEETINHLAYHDPLTDLPNRILFYDRLSVALTHAKRNQHMLAVMFLDLDRFKIVNDMMGHAMGDRLLTEVAAKLISCVRANDTVSRIGGDEFTILLPEISREEDAAVVAKKIIDQLKKPRTVNGNELQITVSIGIALYPNDGEDAETLTKNADTAMYRAKEQGDNYQFFNPSMNARTIQRLESERSLRRALDKNEFEIYYQPQVDIREGCIVGTEALLRWNHPQRGIVLPGDIIPVAEETGLIIPIGEWVLRSACAQNIAWQKAGFPPMKVAINLSAHQFRQKQLVEVVKQALEETGLPPNLLELEITESTAMQDVEFTINMLRSLREMGVKIAIDDFGTGYSSLSYLRRFPITTLKVDQSFVRDVLVDVEDAAIVATIIVLAQNLKLKVIVEGVETEEQLVFFEQQECFEMQGYLFSEPVPGAEIEKILRKAANISRRRLKTV